MEAVFTSQGFLSIPLKLSKPADWIPQIESYLVEYKQNIAGYINDMGKLNTLRQDALALECSHAIVRAVYRYFWQLELITKKFGQLQKPSKIEFEWSDCFDQKHIIGQSSIAFERANVAFNIGALLSKLGTMLPQTEFSNISRHFQASAGLFEYIAENFLHAPLMDLQTPSLHFLRNLMLSQAQECIVLKAIKEGKSSLTIAKLCRSLKAKYDLCCSALNSDDLLQLKENLSDKCVHMIFLKVHLYQSWEAFFFSEYFKSKDKIGTAVYFLKQSMNILETVQSEDNEKLFHLQEMHNYLGNSLKLLEYENDVIYFQPVENYSLSESIFDPIDLTSTPSFVEVVNGFDLSTASNISLFQDIVAPALAESYRNYCEQKMKILHLEKSRLTEQFGFSQNLHELINELNSIKSNSAKFHFEKDYETIETKMEEANSSIDKCSAYLNEAGKLFDKDEIESLSLKQKFGSLWNLNELRNIYTEKFSCFRKEIENHQQIQRIYRDCICNLKLKQEKIGKIFLDNQEKENLILDDGYKLLSQNYADYEAQLQSIEASLNQLELMVISSPSIY